MQGTGLVVWAVQTTPRDSDYSITQAPRVIAGNVIIGNSGAEFGVRGYVSAYDAETGELAWRWYTVPGNPANGFENEAMRRAAETWTGEWWIVGGGGTVWDGVAYDPALGLLYVGTGNGAPYRCCTGAGAGTCGTECNALGDTCDLSEPGHRAQIVLGRDDFGDPRNTACAAAQYVLRGTPNVGCMLEGEFLVPGDPGNDCGLFNFGNDRRLEPIENAAQVASPTGDPARAAEAREWAAALRGTLQGLSAVDLETLAAALETAAEPRTAAFRKRLERATRRLRAAWRKRDELA